MLFQTLSTLENTFRMAESHYIDNNIKILELISQLDTIVVCLLFYFY